MRARRTWSPRSLPSPSAVSLTRPMIPVWSSSPRRDITAERKHGRQGRKLRLIQCVYWRWALLSQLATLTFRAPPDPIEDLLDPIEEPIVGAGEAELEVASASPLRAEAGPGPVGAPEIDEAAVHDRGLEMHPRAGPEGEAAPPDLQVLLHRRLEGT